jgi:hypothetical protein
MSAFLDAGNLAVMFNLIAVGDSRANEPSCREDEPKDQYSP